MNPDQGTLADAMHFLKLSFAKRQKAIAPHPTVPPSTVLQVRAATVPQVRDSTVPQVRGRPLAANLGQCQGQIHTDQTPPTPFWQKRYYDRNVRDKDEFTVKLRYLHRNPVTRGLVKYPDDWKWSSFRHYALREKGPVEIESQQTANDRESKLHGGPSRIFLGPV